MLAMQTSREEIALNKIFYSSSYITNKHHTEWKKRKKKESKLAHNIFNAAIFTPSKEQEKKKKSDYSLKSLYY